MSEGTTRRDALALVAAMAGTPVTGSNCTMRRVPRRFSSRIPSRCGAPANTVPNC